MSYAVIWVDSANEQLAAAYLAARRNGEAAAATTLVDWLDRRLRVAPSTVGESRTGHVRFFTVRPLTVTFEVHEDERVVVVLTVQYVRSFRH